jgi:single-stranded-DNA-specific exonuclease
MRESRRAGLQSILELAEINPANLNEEHIAFELAPRLNALGRLGDANLAVELLTTDDIGQARLLAVQLEILNNQRKLQTEQVYKGAMAQIERDPGLANTPAIVLANPAWPAGVVGIVASRLVECYQKPVVMIATPEGESGRGSARSVEGINITNALKANASLLTGFGGHRMAAGFSIELQRVDEFRRALNRTLEQEGPSLEPRLQISAIITLPDLTLDFVADLERLAPFGAGNPPLILACLDLHLQSAVTVGREGEHLLATIEDGAGQTQQVIWWQSASWPRPEGMFDLAFKARTVTFRGQRAVQVEWVDYRPASTAVSASQVVFTPDVHNYRQEAHPLPVLTSLVNRGGILVWAEADAVTKLAAHGVPAYPRLELNPSESLAIWTPPPGPETLADVLEKVRPKQIYLFAINPETDQLESFLSQLAGLAKHVIRNEQGDVRLEKLAGALAQREVTIRKGLAWMAAKGFLTCQEIRPGELMLTTGGLVEQPAVRGLSQEIEELLAETRAYRTYYTRASKVIDSLMTSRISA